MSAGVSIRPFRQEDASHVRELFVIVNRLLSPPPMREAFEAYIARSLTEEMDRVAAYYGERGGGFWVGLQDEKIVGMFGLEPAATDAMELRRMYVDPSARRSGIARLMLQFAEAECQAQHAKARTEHVRIAAGGAGAVQARGIPVAERGGRRAGEQQDAGRRHSPILFRKDSIERSRAPRLPCRASATATPRLHL